MIEAPSEAPASAPAGSDGREPSPPAISSPPPTGPGRTGEPGPGWQQRSLSPTPPSLRQSTPSTASPAGDDNQGGPPASVRSRARQPAQPPAAGPGPVRAQRAGPAGAGRRIPVLGRARPGDRLSGSPGRGLRLPAHQRLPGWPRRRVRFHQPGAPVRPAPGRLPGRSGPARGRQREVPGPPAHRHRLRADPR